MTSRRDTVVLVGPQAPSPDIGEALAELGIRGRVALVRAGYQERESEDGELVAAMGAPVVNLRLHARGVEVFRDDGEFTAAYKVRQQRLRLMQGFYRTRLEKTEDAARTISVRYVDPELLAQEEQASVSMLRHLDGDHVRRCQALRHAFDARWRPQERPLIARHCQEVREELASCEALVIAGGHVATLFNRLELFDVLSAAADKPIVAWSAGAMVLMDRVILFHDYPPYGSDIAQVLDAGLQRVRGFVALPDPRRRINLEARAGIQRFARRMAPATCVVMDHGARLVFEDGRLVRAQCARLEADGAVEHDWDGVRLQGRAAAPAEEATA